MSIKILIQRDHMRFLLFICASFAGFLFLQIMTSALAKSADTGHSPVIVELFTSQSCSSCPPADKLLGELSENKNIIALSCNVTYWNHLHWEDTLSQDFCTRRQRDYTRSLKSRGPYTPQMVINGVYDVVGNQTGQVNKIIHKAFQDNHVLPIRIINNEGVLDITLPQKEGLSSPVALLLISHANKHTQKIPIGENTGRTVSYTNPVTAITPLGTWDGEAKRISYEIKENAAGYVIIAQTQNGSGDIIAAGQIKN